MDIILHLGAHRCATTTFQAFLDRNRAQLDEQGLAVWTPANTRTALFDGMFGAPGLEGREHIDRVRAAQQNLQADQLIVSEENMIGAPRNNLKYGMLYPELKHRLTRFANAFEGGVTRLGLSIRPYDGYWTSVLSFAAFRGSPLPTRAQAAALASQPRSWTILAQEIRAIFPHVPLYIWTFDSCAGRPRKQFNILTQRPDISHTLSHVPARLNSRCSLAQMRNRLRATGRIDELSQLPRTGRWDPFSTLDRHLMAVRYAHDLRYFRSKADPLITLNATNAAIKVRRLKDTQGPPAFDTGDNHDRQAKMG